MPTPALAAETWLQILSYVPQPFRDDEGSNDGFRKSQADLARLMRVSRTRIASTWPAHRNRCLTSSLKARAHAATHDRNVLISRCTTRSLDRYCMIVFRHTTSATYSKTSIPIPSPISHPSDPSLLKSRLSFLITPMTPNCVPILLMRSKTPSKDTARTRCNTI